MQFPQTCPCGQSQPKTARMLYYKGAGSGNASLKAPLGHIETAAFLTKL
jgi:hypothetical protein